MWFHAKDMPGSHVIVKAQDLDEYTIRLAAKIAAYYSKGKNSSSVPVNYTLVKTLKKPTGSKPGKVILDNYKTIYIDPDDEFLKELTQKPIYLCITSLFITWIITWYIDNVIDTTAFNWTNDRLFYILILKSCTYSFRSNNWLRLHATSPIVHICLKIRTIVITT